MASPVKTFIQHAKRPVGSEAVRGERVDFYFSLQPHRLSPSRAGQWKHLAEEPHGSVVRLVACVCGGMIHAREERR